MERGKGGGEVQPQTMNWPQIKDNKLAKFSINANLTRKAIYKIEYCEVSAF